MLVVQEGREGRERRRHGSRQTDRVEEQQRAPFLSRWMRVDDYSRPKWLGNHLERERGCPWVWSDQTRRETFPLLFVRVESHDQPRLSRPSHNAPNVRRAWV
jgi:hypothetical protein